MRRVLLIVSVVAALRRSGCPYSPSPAIPSPSPVPSASPSYPAGRPNATALENLPLILSLERASGRQTVLFNLVSNGSDLDGRIQGESTWSYEFAERRETTYTFYFWAVTEAGDVQFRGPALPVLPFAFSDLGPVITIDSDAAVELARSYGAEPYVRAHSDARPRPLAARFVGGLPVWNVRFDAKSAPCELGPIYIDARTGDLLARDLWCLSQ
jgi:hypothetical protein